MLNGLLNSNFDMNDVRSMLQGHHLFLQKNTGETADAELQHYVLNDEGVLSNNRHFIAKSQMEAQPNGDATTEGQSLLIIGYCYAYMATKEVAYLEAARKYFNAYIDSFYAGQPIPDDPKRYICNWIVNGKEPVLSNWPIDYELPTHSGFKGEMMDFTNGRCQIPHGAPYWGEYLDKATFAFDGALGWDSIVATVYGLKEDGVTTDWDKKGVQYDVDWVVNYTGKKIDWDGNVLEQVAKEPKGTIQLKNTSVNGKHKFNWGNRQPVEHGGRYLERNKPWHNRPLNVPVGLDKDTGEVTRYEQLGNASDAEQWFADAAYLLYMVSPETDPDKQRFFRAWKSVLITTDEYSDIDSVDKFFRNSKAARTPWTDGISYDFQYPATTQVAYDRDTNGNITVNVSPYGQNSMEQQAVVFHVNNESMVRTTISGQSTQNTPISCIVDVWLTPNRSDEEGRWSIWTFSQPVVQGDIPSAQTPKIGEFLQKTSENGLEFITADERIMAGDYVGVQFEDNVLDGRSAYVGRSVFPKDGGGLIIGFWLTESGKAPIQSGVFRTSEAFIIRAEDDNGWRWYWNIPKTNGAWQNVVFNPSEVILGDYQPNHPDTEPRPAAPVWPNGVTQVTIRPDDDNLVGAEISFYCINEIPKRRSSVSSANAYVMKYRMTVNSGDYSYVYYVGDCDVLNPLESNLYCTPGVIPFSNIYNENTSQFDGWHGMPYPGYQHPFIYLHREDMPNPEDYKLRLNNMIEFMYQSQVAYTNKFGIVGPGMSAYIWDRWDNYKYGTPNTWTMYHWGTDKAWSGYQPRAYFSAARAWYELEIMGEEVPEKLKIYVDRWITWLGNYMERYGGQSPTDFPPDKAPEPLPDDFTSHMCGLWLAGSCMAALSGSKNDKLPNLIEMLAKELNDNYFVSPVPGHVMNGAWTVAARLDTGSGVENNGMFFGFHAGEVMRGLGLYMLYKQISVKEDMYQYVKEETNGLVQR